MKCPHKQICNICEASFKMEHGCNLEKRCPACRFLGLQKNGTKGQHKNYLPLGEELYYSYFPDSINDFNFTRNTMQPQFMDWDEIEEINVELELQRIKREEDMENSNDIVEKMMRYAGDAINERTWKILNEFIMEEINSTEVGAIHGISRTRVQQIVSSAIKTLRNPTIGGSFRFQWRY